MFWTLDIQLIWQLPLASASPFAKATARSGSIPGSAGSGRGRETSGKGWASHCIKPGWGFLGCSPARSPAERSGLTRKGQAVCPSARPAAVPEPDPPPPRARCREEPPAGPAAPADVARPRAGPAAAPSRDPPGQRRAWAGPPRPLPRVPLASQSAQYLLSSSRSSLARMAWCCSFCFCAFSRQERVAMAGLERGWERSCPGAATGTGGRERRLPQPDLLADASASLPARRRDGARTRPPWPRQSLNRG